MWFKNQLHSVGPPVLAAPRARLSDQCDPGDYHPALSRHAHDAWVGMVELFSEQLLQMIDLLRCMSEPLGKGKVATAETVVNRTHNVVEDHRTLQTLKKRSETRPPTNKHEHSKADALLLSVRVSLSSLAEQLGWMEIAQTLQTSRITFTSLSAALVQTQLSVSTRAGYRLLPIRLACMKKNSGWVRSSPPLLVCLGPYY